MPESMLYLFILKEETTNSFSMLHASFKCKKWNEQIDKK